MRDLIERQYHCRIVQWDEPAGAGDGPQFAALTPQGAYICADSLPLLLAALRDAEGAISPMCLLAA